MKVPQSSSSSQRSDSSRWLWPDVNIGCLSMLAAGSATLAFCITKYIISRNKSTTKRADGYVAVDTSAASETATRTDEAQQQVSSCNDSISTRSAPPFPPGVVVVVGLGGVGSHAAHMLSRSGIKKLRLVDFDFITLSSLNRHCAAVHADVGRLKTEVLKEYILSYTAGPDLDIEIITDTFCSKTADRVLRSGVGNKRIAYVLDCIDNTETKSLLLTECLRRGLPVVSSMGAGSRADPTRIHISNISEVKGDELGRAVRMQMVADGGHDLSQVSIPCVWSSESARVGLVALSDEQQKNPAEFGNREGFRLGIVPVVGTIPALFGAAMATQCISALRGPSLPFMRMPPLTEHLVTKMSQTLTQRERLAARDQKLRLSSVNRYDVQFLVCVVWGKADSVTREAMGKGGTRVLTRWHQGRPASRWNLILVTRVMADKLAALFPDAKPHTGLPELPELTPSRVEWIEERLSLAQTWMHQF